MNKQGANFFFSRCGSQGSTKYKKKISCARIRSTSTLHDHNKSTNPVIFYCYTVTREYIYIFLAAICNSKDIIFKLASEVSLQCGRRENPTSFAFRQERRYGFFRSGDDAPRGRILSKMSPVKPSLWKRTTLHLRPRRRSHHYVELERPCTEKKAGSQAVA